MFVFFARLKNRTLLQNYELFSRSLYYFGILVIFIHNYSDNDNLNVINKKYIYLNKYI